MPVPTFCETHGLDRFHIDRILRGQVKRCPPADIVEDIQRATDGRVVPAMWRESTVREDDPEAVPHPADSDTDVDTSADESGPNPAQSADVDPDAMTSAQRKTSAA